MMNKIFVGLLVLTVIGAGVLFWLMKSIPSTSELSAESAKSSEVHSTPEGIQVADTKEHEAAKAEEGATGKNGDDKGGEKGEKAAVAPKSETELSTEAKALEQAKSKTKAPRLNITTVPVPAVVFVDGDVRGQTPVSIELGSKPQTIKIEAAGYAEVLRESPSGKEFANVVNHNWRITLKKVAAAKLPEKLAETKLKPAKKETEHKPEEKSDEKSEEKPEHKAVEKAEVHKEAPPKPSEKHVEAPKALLAKEPPPPSHSDEKITEKSPEKLTETKVVPMNAVAAEPVSEKPAPKHTEKAPEKSVEKVAEKPTEKLAEKVSVESKVEHKEVEKALEKVSPQKKAAPAPAHAAAEPANEDIFLKGKGGPVWIQVKAVPSTDLSQAKTLIAEYRGKVQVPVIGCQVAIPGKGQWVRILSGPYDNKVEAQMALDGVRKSTEKEAFVTGVQKCL